eukprot:TRINITY_DN744_c0_g1_i1.p1 TRINITY_DN744_c0_g1~~TRINITY_DN744_c0_g1_i1.p1  ORF type:complete len:362 (+),score=39.32 TRINITY_DN744_c0_g1_i1:151-1086(+)
MELSKRTGDWSHFQHYSLDLIKWNKNHCFYSKNKKYCDPYFIIIGAPKCGTTSLYYYFRGHPDIYPPVTKELNFFNFNNYSFEYLLNFPVPKDKLSKLNLVSMEASTNYLLNTHAYGEPVYDRIKKGLPDVKLIALLRDPVERFISHFNYVNLWNNDKLQLQEKIDGDMKQVLDCYKLFPKDKCHFTNSLTSKEFNLDNNIIAKSIYIDKIKIWLSRFPNTLKVIISESLFENPEEELIQLHDFLNLPYYKSLSFNQVLPVKEQKLREHENATRVKKTLSPEQTQFLCSFYRPFNEELMDVLGIKKYPWSC